jgi:hypothetical protein
MRTRLAALAGAGVVIVGTTAALHLDSGPARERDAQHLRLELALRSHSPDADRGREVAGPARRARPSALHFARGVAVAGARLRASTTDAPTFGQPTISGVAGVGFEQDLRLDPTNAQRVYTSVPGSLSSDTSWIWQSRDGGKTFRWVRSAAPLTGKPTACAGGGDTELAVDSAGHLYFNDLTLANFSTGRSDDQGATFPCSNTGVPDTAVDRQWYATDGDPTAGGSIYLVNDEIGPGAVTCDVSGQVNNVLAMYRSPLPGGGASAGIQFGPARQVTRPQSCDEGIMGNDEISPVATRTGQIVDGHPTKLPSRVRHVYVIHDDATLSKIAIGRCFPVAFGPPVTNVSDPSGLDCVDLPVADLGKPSEVRTGGDFPTLAIDRAGNLYAVWEQAPVNGDQIGDSALMYAFSTDEGNTWSTPIQIPTPGLANNVFAWTAAGDDGRVDIAWYGTPAHADPSNAGCPQGGPDSVDGRWSLFLAQTLNGHDASGVTFTAPILAGEHYVHRGSIQTLLGHQCGDRTLGDFLQLRVGRSGEAQIAYADSNNVDEPFAPHGMHVRQIGGTGVFAGKTVSGEAILSAQADDPAGDGLYEAGGVSSANMPQLDIVRSRLVAPAPADCHPAGTPCLRARLTLNDLSLTPPAPPDTDTDAVWLTQWLVPAAADCTSSAPACRDGGKNFFVYAESTAGGSIRCYVGENAAQLIGGGVTLTYPGTTEITAAEACKVVTGPNGTITIDVPKSFVSLDPGVSRLDSKLYSVTASTMTLPAPAGSVPPVAGLGGIFFNLIDVVRGYDSTG